MECFFLRNISLIQSGRILLAIFLHGDGTHQDNGREIWPFLCLPK